MRNTIPTLVLWAAALSLAGATQLAQAADTLDGMTVYNTKCKTCHGADGSGVPNISKMFNVNMKPLGGAQVQANSDAVLLADINTGVGKMKPIKVTSAEAADVLAYLRTMNKK
jgi:cytochrome c